MTLKGNEDKSTTSFRFNNSAAYPVDEAYRVGQKSKLLILSEYVNKTEKLGGMWTKKNSYRENEVLSDVFTWIFLRHNCFIFKYSETENSQWNYC